MTQRRLLRAFCAVALTSLVAGSSSADEARALTDSGSVLTIANWSLVTLDGGIEMRIADDRVLGWELRDDAGVLVGQGLVPGSESTGIDATPALSRSPLTGELWLAWSRQAASGTAREIAVERFAGTSWSAGSLSIVASDSDDQLDPAIVHDEAGTAWLSWVDGVNDRTIRFAGISPEGRLLGQRNLSDGVSRLSGAPAIGIDATGQLFVAYAGTPSLGGDVTLFVLTPNPIGGGLTHVPDPFIELGLRGSMPAPSIGVVTNPSGDPIPSRVNLTVLGGTPVAWWTESAQNGAPIRFHYAAQGSAGWTMSDVRTLDLGGGWIPSVPEALALVEARLRRVIAQSPGTVVLPPIVQPDTLGRLQIRR